MPNQSVIDDLVFETIGQAFSHARLFCNIGWVSLENPGLKRKPNFLNSFSFATEVDEIDYISQFTRSAKIDVVRDFYRQTNGMRLLGNNFSVPGVLFHRDDFEGHDFDCVALDFSNHGGILLPKFSPEDGLVIGTSHRKGSVGTIQIFDILNSEGNIIGGEFGRTGEGAVQFRSITKWLTIRIQEAASELQREIKASMN